MRFEKVGAVVVRPPLQKLMGDRPTAFSAMVNPYVVI